MTTRDDPHALRGLPVTGTAASIVNFIASESTDERVAEVVAALITCAVVMAQRLPEPDRKATAAHLEAEALTLVETNVRLSQSTRSPRVRRWDGD